MGEDDRTRKKQNGNKCARKTLTENRTQYTNSLQFTVNKTSSVVTSDNSTRFNELRAREESNENRSIRFYAAKNLLLNAVEV